MATITTEAPALGIRALCDALAVPRATYYRHRRLGPAPARRRPPPGRALAASEREAVLARLYEPRFADRAPGEVYAQLLDEGTYLCSERTMYRVLAAAGARPERRNQQRHPAYAAPELLATQPNQLWSWDITKLRGPTTWTYYYLYVLLDVFSRYVVGWQVAHRESAELAKTLIARAVAAEGIARDQLTVHADRGAAMTSKPVAVLLADLGITKTHSRPHVSNDNPYSEAQFKTFKHQPGFPERFGCYEDARGYSTDTLRWYNLEHRHSGLGWHTPHAVHHGLATAQRARRAVVLAHAFTAHPERFVRRAPTPPPLPTAAWINPPVPAIRSPADAQ